jgi:hypothetical protein
MTRHVLNSVINIELDVKTRLKQRRNSQLDTEMPITTSNDVTRPVVKSVVSGQLGVEHDVKAVATRQ